MADRIPLRLLNILINNAGMTGDEANVAPSLMTRRGMRLFETNLLSVVAVNNAMLPLLRKSEAAWIVNVSSAVGSLSALNDPRDLMWRLSDLAYAASKAADGAICKGTAGGRHLSQSRRHCVTDLSAFFGDRIAAKGASVIVQLATLPNDGPTAGVHGAAVLGVAAMECRSGREG